MIINGQLTGEIIGAAIEVHKQLGPGLLESVYEECLEHDLKQQGLTVDRQVQLPINYKGKELSSKLRIDLLVNQQFVVELKSIQKIEPIHEAQVLTYLKLSKKKVGLLLNFNVPVMKQGIRRFINEQV